MVATGAFLRVGLGLFVIEEVTRHVIPDGYNTTTT